MKQRNFKTNIECKEQYLTFILMSKDCSASKSHQEMNFVIDRQALKNVMMSA